MGSTLLKTRVHKTKITMIIYTLLVLYLSCLNYFRNYWYPPHLFWDENYHIASAYKYLNQVMFMEPHPPLGKLFIALGEYIFHPNENLDTTYFLTTDYIKDIPPGFSFVGVRFFPVLFATLAAVLFFFILYKISKNPHLSFLFSSFYLFDNALIVHNRGAMLEGIQIFFILAAFLYFLILFDVKKINNLQYFIMGLLVGLAVSVKLTGAIMVLTFIPLFAKSILNSDQLKKPYENELRISHLHQLVWLYPVFFYTQKNLSPSTIVKTFLSKAMLFFLAISLIFCGVYYVHGMLGKNIVEDRYYATSAVYAQILADKQVHLFVLENPPFYKLF